MARVHLSDDYYVGPCFSNMATLAEYAWMNIYEIPQEQLERWEKAEAAYLQMQEEITEVIRSGNKAGKKIPHFPGLPH